MVPEWPAARRHSEPGRGIGRPSLRPRASLPDGRQYIKLRSGISSVLVSSECLEPSNAVVEANVQEWPATAALIIAEVIGSGVLALGGQTAVVGLVPPYRAKTHYCFYFEFAEEVCNVGVQNH